MMSAWVTASDGLLNLLIFVLNMNLPTYTQKYTDLYAYFILFYVFFFIYFFLSCLSELMQPQVPSQMPPPNLLWGPMSGSVLWQSFVLLHTVPIRGALWGGTDAWEQIFLPHSPAREPFLAKNIKEQSYLSLSHDILWLANDKTA